MTVASTTAAAPVLARRVRVVGAQALDLPVAGVVGPLAVATLA